MSDVTPARRVAFSVIRRVFEQDAYADRALHGEARGLDARERSLAMQLAYGTVQRKLTLDHHIEHLAGRAVDELDPPTLAALRLGLYQLVCLDGVAAHAAVGESVELAKGGRGGGHKLVTAVLRRAARGELPALPADDTPAGAAVAHSYPPWLVELWWERFGADETRALLRAGNAAGELALRVNTLVAEPAAVIAALAAHEPPVRARPAGDGLPEGVVVEGAFDAHGHPLYAQGAYAAQSRAAMLVGRAVDPQPGERVLDLCAAPGGKTTHLAALMEGTGEVVAVERNPQRARALQATAARLRAANVTVVTADTRDYDGAGRFDRVLLDPPCSGLGTLRSHPDLRWRTSPEAVERLAAEQDVLLASARRALAPGGALVYSVCTLSPREERLVTATVQRTFPHVDGTDGFYIARDGG